MSREEIFVSVIVQIAGVHPHTPLGFAVGAHRGAGKQAHVLERPIPLVDPQDVLAAVVGHVNVHPSVVVEIGGDDAERRAEWSSLECCGCDIGKRPIAVVPVQAIAPRPVHGRRAVIASPCQPGALLVRFDVPLHVVPDVQVQPSITIVVDERGRHAPSGEIRAALHRHVGEGSVTVVAEQLVLPNVRQIQVDAPVVVEISRGHAHPVRMRVYAARFGDVREMQHARPVGQHAQIVPVKAPLERQRGRLDRRLAQRLPFAQHLPLDDVHVEVAVVVVVQQRDARRQHLRKIEFSRHPVEVGEPQAGLLGPIDEPIDGIAIHGSRSGRLSRAGATLIGATCGQERHRQNDA